MGERGEHREVRVRKASKCVSAVHLQTNETEQGLVTIYQNIGMGYTRILTRASLMI